MTILPTSYHVFNVLFICIIYICFQISRSFSEEAELIASGRIITTHTRLDTLRDTTFMLTAITLMYVFSFYLHQWWSQVLASIVAVFGIGFHLKFRFVDDIKKGAFSLQLNRRNYLIENAIFHYFRRRLIDHLLRSYLYIAFFFCIIYVSIVPNELNYNNIGEYYSISSDLMSHNTFIDMYVFSFSSLTTLDASIQPKAILPKVVWTCQIIVGIGFNGLIFGLFVSTFSELINKAQSSLEINPVSKDQRERPIKKIIKIMTSPFNWIKSRLT